MGDIEIEQATDTVYRWRCHRCGEEGPYDTSSEQVEAWAETHEEHLCAKRRLTKNG